jgi:hypothetical protein
METGILLPLFLPSPRLPKKTAKRNAFSICFGAWRGAKEKKILQKVDRGFTCTVRKTYGTFRTLKAPGSELCALRRISPPVLRVALAPVPSFAEQRSGVASQPGDTVRREMDSVGVP